MAANNAGEQHPIQPYAEWKEEMDRNVAADRAWMARELRKEQIVRKTLVVVAIAVVILAIAGIAAGVRAFIGFF